MAAVGDKQGNGDSERICCEHGTGGNREVRGAGEGPGIGEGAGICNRP